MAGIQVAKKKSTANLASSIQVCFARRGHPRPLLNSRAIGTPDGDSLITYHRLEGSPIGHLAEEGQKSVTQSDPTGTSLPQFGPQK
jgi:hypothetical protein